jgi:hypothetical protein
MTEPIELPAAAKWPSESFMSSHGRTFPRPPPSIKAAGWGHWSSNGIATTDLHNRVAYTPGQESFQTPFNLYAGGPPSYTTWSPKPPTTFPSSPKPMRTLHFGGGGETWQNCGVRVKTAPHGWQNLDAPPVEPHGTSYLDGLGADRTRGLPDSESKRVWSQRSFKEMADFGTVPAGLPRGLAESEKKLWLAIYVKAAELLQTDGAPSVRTAVDRAVLDVTGSIAGFDDGAGRNSIEYRFAMRWSHSIKTCLAMRQHYRSNDTYS